MTINPLQILRDCVAESNGDLAAAILACDYILSTNADRVTTHASFAQGSDTQGGKWRTLGGHPDPETDEEHVGGYRVLIGKDGVILKGRGKGKHVSKLGDYFKQLKRGTTDGREPEPDGRGIGRGRAGIPQSPQAVSGPVEGAPEEPSTTGDGKGRESEDFTPSEETTGDTGVTPEEQILEEEVSEEETPVTDRLEQVNKRMERYRKFFEKKGNKRVVEWLDVFQEHINEIGVEAALESMDDEWVNHGPQARVQYGSTGPYEEGDKKFSFMQKYLDRAGIQLQYSDTPDPNLRTIASAPVSEEQRAKYKPGDVIPTETTLDTKLTESKLLPGLETTEDLDVIIGSKVTNLTPEVMKKLDAKYGKGKWIIKSYGDESYAGFGIFFPQRAKEIQSSAKDAIFWAEKELSKHGYTIARDKDGKAIGIQKEGIGGKLNIPFMGKGSGKVYPFNSQEFNNIPNREVKELGRQVAAAAPSEKGALLPRTAEDVIKQDYGVYFIRNEHNAVIAIAAPDGKRIPITPKLNEEGNISGIAPSKEYNKFKKEWDEEGGGALSYALERAMVTAYDKPSEVGFMAQPAFEAVGVTDADRAMGATWETSQEGRVHVVVIDGKAHVVPYATAARREDSIPVVFSNDDIRAMEKAAQDTIDQLPAELRTGQTYAPDVMKTKDGWKVVELNTSVQMGQSAWLEENPLVIDAYVSFMTGRDPTHVRFIRNLLRDRMKSSGKMPVSTRGKKPSPQNPTQNRPESTQNQSGVAPQSPTPNAPQSATVPAKDTPENSSLSFAFDPKQHPRKGKGEGGGQFTERGGSNPKGSESGGPPIIGAFFDRLYERGLRGQLNDPQLQAVCFELSDYDEEIQNDPMWPYYRNTALTNRTLPLYTGSQSGMEDFDRFLVNFNVQLSYDTDRAFRVFAFDPSKHPRKGKGERGGQFTRGSNPYRPEFITDQRMDDIYDEIKGIVRANLRQAKRIAKESDRPLQRVLYDVIVDETENFRDLFLSKPEYFDFTNDPRKRYEFENDVFDIIIREIAKYDDPRFSHEWNPKDHPRKRKGVEGGGRFIRKPYDDDFPNIPDRTKAAIVRTIKHWSSRIEEMAREEMELDGLDEPPSMLTMMYDIVEEEFSGFPSYLKAEIRDFIEREMAKHIDLSLSHEWNPKDHPRKGRGKEGGQFVKKDKGGRVYSIKHGKLQVKYSVHKNKRIRGPKIKLTNYKQQDAHSCGFVAALTISKYFDPDTDPHDVLKAVRPSINYGVNRYNLIDALDTLGIDSYYITDLTVGDLRRYVRKGIPVIVSVWPDEWVSDHWTIVQGFDDEDGYVYLTNHKRLPLALFKKQWSDMDMRSKGNSSEGIVCFPQGEDEDTFDSTSLSFDSGKHPRKGKGEGGGRFINKPIGYKPTTERDIRREEIFNAVKGAVKESLEEAKRKAKASKISVEEAMFRSFIYGTVLDTENIEASDWEEFREDAIEIIRREIAKYDDTALSLDSQGHEHRGKGPGGGQFTSKGSSNEVIPEHKARLPKPNDRWQKKALLTAKLIDESLDPNDFVLKLVPVDSVIPTQHGEDYDNDSSRETANNMREVEYEGIHAIAQTRDYFPVVLRPDGRILDGNHRHAAHVMNNYKYMWAMVPKSSASFSTDATGHEHRGTGPGGGQFTSKGQGGNRAVRRKAARAGLQRPQQPQQQVQPQPQAPQKAKVSEKVTAATLKLKTVVDAVPEGVDTFIDKVIEERGLPPQHAERVKKINRVVNAIATAAAQAATFTAPGSETPDDWLVGAITKNVPVGSLAYLAYSTVRNPLAVIRAARRMIKGSGRTHAQQAQQSAAMSFDPKKHPRKAKGSEEGGRFVRKGTSSEETTDEDEEKEDGDSRNATRDWSKMFLYGHVKSDSPEESEAILRSLIGDLEDNPTAKTLAYSPIVRVKYLKGGGANGSFLVDFEDDEMTGVFKPAEQEMAGLRGSVEGGTYYQREIAAYDVAKILGFDDLVPVTTLRINDTQIGSIQQFVDGKVAAKFYSKDENEKFDGDKDLARAAVFDYLVGNLDRNHSNWLIREDDGRLVLIDHGLCFPNSKDPYDWTNMNLIGEAIKRRLTLPDLSDWEGKWPEIEEVLKRTLSKEAIALTKDRFDALIANDYNTRIANLPGTDPYWSTLRDQVENWME